MFTRKEANCLFIITHFFKPKATEVVLGLADAGNSIQHDYNKKPRGINLLGCL